ncbi:hypothetical protein Trydic_g4794 [Trypoxylus dichotomus]
MERIGIVIALCSTIFAAVVYDLNIGDKCGPNNEGECVLVTSCLEASEKLRNGEPHNMDRCGFQGKTETVCCKRSKLEAKSPANLTPAIAACERYFPSKFYSFKSLVYVIWGQNASLGDFPHIASLHIEGDEPGQMEWGNCAGSLISETFVVTAAHCVLRVDSKVPVMVRLGKIDLLGDVDKAPPQNIPIQAVIVHPNYNHAHSLNDIALLRLKEPAVFTDYVKPICLNTNTNIRYALSVAGWGYINRTILKHRGAMQPEAIKEPEQAISVTNLNKPGRPRAVEESVVNDPSTSILRRFQKVTVQRGNLHLAEETSRFLQKAYVAPYDLNQCNETYFNSPRPRTILPTHLCALSRNTIQRQDTCQGDSGGPLQFDDLRALFLVGITSFGRSCGGPTPSVYTRISEFVGWIEPIVWP